MRMSQELARQISYRMTEKKTKEVEKLYLDLRKYVTDEYNAITPKAVKMMFKKHPEWLYTTNTVKLEGCGFRYEYVTTITKVIANKQSDAFMPVNKEVYGEALKLLNKHAEAKKAVESLQAEIRTALNGLKTFTQIQKHLPEAVKYLPKSTSMKLMVNFDTLREKIKAA